MKFILREIKLWYKDQTIPTTSYKFLPNKINVITGDSTTGKTSIWSIIDYCLLNGKTRVAYEINQKVDWYGISFSINEKDVSIARKSSLEGVSNDIYYVLGEFGTIPIPNANILAVKQFLDEEFGLTDQIKYPLGKKNRGNLPTLSFRHFLIFNSLTETIISAQDLYFDIAFYDKEEYEELLTSIFDLAIGVDNTSNIIANEKIKDIQKLFNKNYSLNKKDEKNRENERRKLNTIVSKLKENNFIEYSLEVESLDAAGFLIDDIVSNAKKTAENSNLKNELDDLGKKRIEIKAQLAIIEKYRKDYNEYKRSISKTSESLKPIEYLKKNLSEQLLESYETKYFIDSIENSFRDIRDHLSKSKPEPLDVAGDVTALQRELSDIELKINRLQEIRTDYQDELKRFMALGEIKTLFENANEKLNNVLSTFIDLTLLAEEKKLLENSITDLAQLRQRMRNKLDQSIQRNKNLLNLSSILHDSELSFNNKSWTLDVYPKGLFVPIENIGSKSNYMFMHLCFYLGLHEHMISINQVHVPQFLFIDQPSIPYYSRETESIGNDDKSKLIDAFSLLNSFIEYICVEKKVSFQILMVEHASPQYWQENKLTHFHTVDEFIDGKGLLARGIL
jgi:hypothetical protein